MGWNNVYSVMFSVSSIIKQDGVTSILCFAFISMSC